MNKNPFSTQQDPLIEAASTVINRLTFIDIPDSKKPLYGFFDLKGMPKSVWRGGPKEAIFKSFVTFEELTTIRNNFKLTPDELSAVKQLEPGDSMKLSNVVIKRYIQSDVAKIVEWLTDASAGSGPSSTKDLDKLFQYSVGAQLLPKDSRAYSFPSGTNVTLSKYND